MTTNAKPETDHHGEINATSSTPASDVQTARALCVLMLTDLTQHAASADAGADALHLYESISADLMAVTAAAAVYHHERPRNDRPAWSVQVVEHAGAALASIDRAIMATVDGAPHDADRTAAYALLALIEAFPSWSEQEPTPTDPEPSPAETNAAATVAAAWPQFFPKPDDDTDEIDARAHAAGWTLARVDETGRRYYEPARLKLSGEMVAADFEGTDEEARAALEAEPGIAEPCAECANRANPAACRVCSWNDDHRSMYAPRREPSPAAECLLAAPDFDEDDGPAIVDGFDEIEARAYRDGFDDARNQYEPEALVTRAALSAFLVACVHDCDETDNAPGAIMAAIWNDGTNDTTTAKRIRQAVADAEAALGY